MKRILIVALVAASLGAPVSSAQAGFCTDVVKGAVKNNIRHSKRVVKDAADFTRLVGRCAANRVTGRQC